MLLPSEMWLEQSELANGAGMQRGIPVSQRAHTQTYGHTQTCTVNSQTLAHVVFMNWVWAMCERSSMVISACQGYINVCVCLCMRVLNVRSLCLMKIAGDPEISPICGILWSFLFPISLPLFLSISPCRSDRGGVWCRRGVGLQVRIYGASRFEMLSEVNIHTFVLFLEVSETFRFSYVRLCYSVCLCVCVSMCRSRAVVSVEAAMILTPRILNPDDRQCHLPETDIMVTW